MGHKMPTSISLNLSVNGQLRTVSSFDDTQPLLYILRNQLGELGPKFGCGVAQCGACTVLVNGTITRSCVMQIKNVANGAQVTTLEGLGSSVAPHPLQKAFIDAEAGQCAYCINGMIMGAYSWLNARFNAGNRAVPSDDEVKDFLTGVGQTPPFVYLCRCGSHLRIIRAIQQAAREMS